MNFVLGAATSHWVTGSTWTEGCQFSCLEQEGRLVAWETHDNLWNLQGDGHLSYSPHADGRVQQHALAVDEPQHSNDGDAVPNRAVVLDLAPLRDMGIANESILLDDSGQVRPQHPILVVWEA